MAKEIRTVKRDLWRSDDFNGLSRDARLTWVALISYADDHGRFKADPRELWAFAWLHDGDMHVEDVGHHLAEMVERGMIHAYSVDGRDYFEIPTWSKHQRVDNAAKSPIPAPRGDSPQSAAVRGELPHAAAGGEGRGEEGRGDAADRGEPPAPFCSKHPGGTDDPCRACGNARRRRDEWDAEVRNRATPTPKRGPCDHSKATKQGLTVCECDARLEDGVWRAVA
ncbi:MAG TPA: hypothetical protein VNR37_03360 [Microbacteriaceae bacterium]|nr:hypothetical protein [Microbacteriaceae bacterium]